MSNSGIDRISLGRDEVDAAFSMASGVVGEESGLDHEQLFLAKSTIARMILERADMVAALENIERQQEIEKLNAVYGKETKSE